MSFMATMNPDTSYSASWDLLDSELDPNDFLDVADFSEFTGSPEDLPDLQSFLDSTETPLPDTPSDALEWMVTDTASKRLRAPRLFEFLLLLLQKSQYVSYASYKDRSKGIFEIHEPDKVAALWQRVRSRQSAQDMTYDKLARAIRWYYPKGIMVKTNARYTFQFSPETVQATMVDGNNNTHACSSQMQ